MANLFKGFGILLIGILFMVGCGEDNRVLTSITVTPSPATVGVLKTQRFYATAYDQSGRELSTTFTWSVSSGLGTINADGLFSAGAAELSGKVTATSQGVSGSADVSVTTKGSITGTVRNMDAGVVSGIRVYLISDPGNSATTNSVGRYTLSGITPGSCEVKTGENATYFSASKEVTVATGETATADLTIPYRFTVESENGLAPPISLITGTIRNNGSTEAREVTILYSFFDEDGLIVGTARGSAGNILGFKTATFSAFPSIPIDSYATFQRVISAKSF